MTASRFVKEKESIRKRLLKYTRRAFRMLPEMGGPRMLDIGCGSGVPTLELARSAWTSTGMGCANSPERPGRPASRAG
jgi:ubiquinone/menaquinone biosynthesis C-methylase UbiE